VSPLTRGDGMKRCVLAAVISAVSAGACSSTTVGGGGGGSSGGADAGHDVAALEASSGADTGTAADVAEADTPSDGGCGVVTNGAAVVPEQNTATAPPTPQGGAIPDGTYFVTAATLYTGPGGATGPTGKTYQFTSQVSGDGTAYDSVDAISGGTPVVAVGTIAISGARITVTQICPTTTMPVSAYVAFDSNGVDTVTLYTSTPPISALTFTRQ
jgi:hypothetical protein